MLRLPLSVLLLLFSPLALAQVNVEKLRSQPIEDGWTGSAGLNTTFTNGNIDYIDMGLTGHLAWQKDPHLVFAISSGRFAAKRTQADYLADPNTSLWEDEAQFANVVLQHFRYNYTLKDWLWWEAYTQYEFNEFLLLDRRLLLGTGPRVAVFEGEKSGMWIGTSAMVESERLNAESVADDPSTMSLRWSNYLSTTLRPSKQTSWVTTAYIQPRVDAFSDYRLFVESGLAFKLNSWLSFTADVKLREDTAPPNPAPGVAPVLARDLSIKNGFKITW